MSLAPVRQNSLTDSCYTRIKEAILRLDIRPGTPLVETQLAAQLGTSKSPVRESLLRLASENLVIPAPGRSAVVAGLTIDTIRDWYDLRSILEPSSLASIASDLTDEQLARLRQAHLESVAALEADDPANFVHGSESLHLQLVRLNPNRTLVKLVEQLLEQIRRVRVALYDVDQQEHAQSGRHVGIERHGNIIDLLAARRLDEAQELLRVDIRTFLDRLDDPQVRAALEATQFPLTTPKTPRNPTLSLPGEEGIPQVSH